MNFLNEKGFSLLSVAGTFLAIGVISSVYWLNLESSTSQKSLTITIEKMDAVVYAIKKYRENHGGSPPLNLTHLYVPQTPACQIDTDTQSPTYRQYTGWCGPYLRNTFSENQNEFLIDGWGTPFTYDAVWVKSCGRNKTCGDSDDIVKVI